MSQTNRMHASAKPKPTNKWLALATTSVGTFMSTLNASIVNIANPIFAAEFGVSMAQVQWISTLYLIITCSVMLLFGRLGDRVGSHKIYIVGIAIFTFGSLACALAGSFEALLVARALQGLGAAMMVAVSIGLVATIFPLAERGRAMGLNVLMVGLGNVTGPAVGGLVLAYSSWPFIFMLSIPFGAVAFVMAALWLRSPLPKSSKASLALRSSVLFGVAITSLIILLSGGFVGQQWFGLVFIVSLLLLIASERHAQDPLFVPALLRNKRFMLGNLIALLSYCAYVMMLFQIPFFLDAVWAIPVGTVGLLIMASALALAVSGPASGFASDRFGAFKIMVPALVVFVVCIVAALFLGVEESIGLFILVMILAGVGMGFLNTPNNSDIMTAAGREHASYASGFVATNRNLGFCIGTALSASIFSLGGSWFAWMPGLFGIAGSSSGGAESEHLFSFRVVLLVCLVLVLVSLGVCVYLKRGAQTQPMSDAAMPADNNAANPTDAQATQAADARATNSKNDVKD